MLFQKIELEPQPDSEVYTELLLFTLSTIATCPASPSLPQHIIAPPLGVAPVCNPAASALSLKLTALQFNVV